jgi:anti-sigma factor RsiW
MNCSDYVDHFSDFLDGTAPAHELGAFDAHLEECEACRRYRSVMEQGSRVLRALPEPELTDDFGPRLQHRLYHVDDAVALANGGSATPAMTVVGMALLLTAIAWSPALMPNAPQVALEPIVVDQAPRRASRTFPVRSTVAMPGELPKREPLQDFESGLWDDAQGLMYEYSPLSQRYRQRSSVRRTGLDRDR